jgi:hypothetical protein
VSGDGLAVHPLRNDVKLRPATAAYYGVPSAADAPAEETIAWPSGALRLHQIFSLADMPSDGGAVAISLLAPADAYQQLLQQAHAFTLAIPEVNRQLMVDYLRLAAVPTFELRYQKAFDAMDQILDAVEAQARVR